VHTPMALSAGTRLGPYEILALDGLHRRVTSGVTPPVYSVGFGDQ
jgi:hypothetical protein